MVITHTILDPRYSLYQRLHPGQEDIQRSAIVPKPRRDILGYEGATTLREVSGEPSEACLGPYDQRKPPYKKIHEITDE